MSNFRALPKPNPWSSAAKGAALIGAVVVALVCAMGCTSQDGNSGTVGPADGVGGYPNDDASVSLCTDGATQNCSVTVGQHGTVLTCYDGVQTCQNGHWGECADGQVVQRLQVGDGMHTMSLTDAGACKNNPCDPSCQSFNEVPDGGVTLDGSQSGVTWQTGNLNNLNDSNFPKGLVAKGMSQPCYQGTDCQYDQYCQAPLTAAACAHSKCTTGSALDPTCETCVEKVCAAKSSCCTSSWTSDCIKEVGTVCNSFCDQSGTCAHSKCLTGGNLTSGCDSCVTSICSLRPSCCSSSGAWDNYCLAMVGSVCNYNCQAGGTCAQYNPGQTNPDCTGLPDLTAGVPCGNTIPICNRGSVAVQPNTTSFWVYPANSGHFQECGPDLTPKTSGGSQWPKKCPIPDKIDPGQCVSESCPYLDQTKEVVVNPSTAPNAIAECSCQNNWSLYKKASGSQAMTCGAPACDSLTTKASIATVNMFVMFDKSGSMAWTPSGSSCWGGCGANSRFGLTTSALKAFIRDSASAGIRVAVRFFPDYDPGTFTVCPGYLFLDWGWNGYGWYWDESTCDFDGCAVPSVGLGPLLTQQVSDPPPSDCSSSADSQECNLVTAIEARSPGGDTPMYQALEGAESYMGTYIGQHPLERAVVVLVTDGEPNGYCDWNENDIAGVAQSAYKNWGVITYTVGLGEANMTFLQNVATQGGGQSFALSTSTPTADLVSALNQIRNNTVSCDLQLDQSTAINPNDVTLNFTSGTGTVTQFTQVQASGNCSTLADKWYFDNNTTPTKLTLCPATCSLVRGDLGAKLSLTIGCPVTYKPITMTQVYTAQCPPGTAPQWDYLTWVSTTPSDSYIKFEGRTSSDPTTFNTAPTPGSLTQLGIAHAVVSPYTTNTQTCAMTGPTPDCPADLYKAFGKPADNLSNLEVRATLYPSTTGSTSTPVLSSWNVTYSCVATE